MPDSHGHPSRTASISHDRQPKYKEGMATGVTLTVNLPRPSSTPNSHASRTSTPHAYSTLGHHSTPESSQATWCAVFYTVTVGLSVALRPPCTEASSSFTNAVTGIARSPCLDTSRPSISSRSVGRNRRQRAAVCYWLESSAYMALQDDLAAASKEA